MRDMAMKTFRTFASTAWATLLLAIFATASLAADITVNLVAEKVNVTMGNTGEVIPMWGYRLESDPAGSATVPGPTISAAAGDTLTITLTNSLDQGPGLVEPTSVVIPGQQATEANAMVPTWTDGSTGSRAGDLNKRVRSFTHEVAAGGTGTYQWANLKAGTYLVQSGTHPAVQIQMGLYAVLKVDDTGQSGAQVHGRAYQSEQVMLFSEIDPVLHAAVFRDDYGPGKSVPSTMEYHPKYFLLNGVPYANAGDLAITGPAGSDILVRFLNAGLETRVPQLNGAYMTLLAEDGHPVPFPKDQHSLVLPPSKTFEVLVSNAPAESLALFDRRASFSTDQNQNVLTLSAKIGVFRNGAWYLDANGNGIWDPGTDRQYANFGQTGDLPVTGDWNGNGTSEIGVFRNGRWFLDNNNNGQWDADSDTYHPNFGSSGDLPVIGDWNGDGNSQIAVFRAGSWFFDVNGNGQWDSGTDLGVAGFGAAGDRPIAGDWNGDGRDEIGVYRNGEWYLDADGDYQWNAANDIHFAAFGLAGDLPVIGDWDGDGTQQVGLFRSGQWFLDDGSGQWEFADDTTFAGFGGVGDLPISGLW